MAYLGLARKWRPQTFDDLVGQSHIARTLSNAIKAGRISQGYLFTGTRGIGKTSSARIFAKALRCLATSSPGIPCNACTDCTEIAEGRSVDVLEIDGASNNGVDAVREIRENAKYLPSTGKHKIYIIDEVHMLTTAAFNALLKTLEEPPAHVIFIFATTDPQKIPATVLSRTQRFDFKRVSQKDLSDRLKHICETEKVTIDSDALTLISREAEGSMRDAVSLLDQIFSVGGTKITGASVADALGLVDKQTVLDCVTGILKRRPLDAVQAVGKVYLHGFDLKQFGREILRYLRQIMVARLLEQNIQGGLSSYMDLSDVDLSDVKSLVQERSLDDLDMLFRMLSNGLEDVARSSIPKMVLDVLIIKMASSESLIGLVDLKGPESLTGNGTGTGTGTGADTDAHRTPTVTAPSQNQTATPVKSRATEILNAIENARFETPPAARTTGLQTKPAPKQTAPAPDKSPTAPQSLHDAQGWIQIVDSIKSQRPLVGNVLENLSLESLTTEGVTLVVCLGFTKDKSFYRDQLQSRAYNELLTQMLKNHLGRAVRLEYKEVLSSRSIETIEQERRRDLAEERKRTVLESEAMKATQQLLGAKLERLEISELNH